MPHDDGLHDDWVLLAREGGADETTAARDHVALLRRYREPQRAYHTIEHVGEVLACIARLVTAGEPVEDLWAVRAAAWFHDAVYDPVGEANEEASARLAVTVLRSWGVPPRRLQQVEALVLLTAHHRPRDTHGVPLSDAVLLVDADLWVLAAPARRYDAYVRAIRHEYGHLDDETFTSGRRAFLDAMLARPRIFSTAAMAASEAAARHNMGRERERLAGRH